MTEREKQYSDLIDGCYRLQETADSTEEADVHGAILHLRRAMKRAAFGPDAESVT